LTENGSFICSYQQCQYVALTIKSQAPQQIKLNANQCLQLGYPALHGLSIHPNNGSSKIAVNARCFKTSETAESMSRTAPTGTKIDTIEVALVLLPSNHFNNPYCVTNVKDKWFSRKKPKTQVCQHHLKAMLRQASVLSV